MTQFSDLFVTYPHLPQMAAKLARCHNVALAQAYKTISGCTCGLTEEDAAILHRQFSNRGRRYTLDFWDDLNA